MNFFWLNSFLIILNLSSPLTPQNNLISYFETREPSKVFRGQVVGAVLSFSSKSKYNNESLREIKTFKNRVTVFLNDFTSGTIKRGDTIYIINHNSLLVSNIKVENIFSSYDFGFLLVGSGNFNLASVGDRVVLAEKDLKKNFFKGEVELYKKRGRIYQKKGEYGKAIAVYQKALKIDYSDVKLHLSLAEIYLEDDLKVLADKEIAIASQYISKILDSQKRSFYLKLVDDLKNSLKKKKKVASSRKIIPAQKISSKKKRLKSKNSEKVKEFFLNKIKRHKNINRKNLLIKKIF